MNYRREGTEEMNGGRWSTEIDAKIASSTNEHIPQAERLHQTHFQGLNRPKQTS